MENSVTKIQEDYMYKNFGIIPNHIYNFQFRDGNSINGTIMNFDSNTFCVMGVKGMYIIKRGDINSMCPSNMSKNIWEENRTKYLESFVQPN